MAEPQHFVAQLADEARLVRNENDGRAGRLELSNPLKAAPLESDVAHGQNLVDEQHPRLGVHRQGEAEAHLHTAAVGAQWIVDEFPQLSKLDNRIEALRHLGA
jgi:hypothetical protein